jgi:hypothetical protein
VLVGITILQNGLIFDGRSEELVEGGSVVIENDKIREVSAGDVLEQIMRHGPELGLSTVHSIRSIFGV